MKSVNKIDLAELDIFDLAIKSLVLFRLLFIEQNE